MTIPAYFALANAELPDRLPETTNVNVANASAMRRSQKADRVRNTFSPSKFPRNKGGMLETNGAQIRYVLQPSNKLSELGYQTVYDKQMLR